MYDDRDAIIMSDADRARMEAAKNPQNEVSYDPWGNPNPPEGPGLVVDIYHFPKKEPEYGTGTKQFPSDGDVNTEKKDGGGGSGLWDGAQSILGSVALVLLGIVLVILALLSTDIGMRAVDKL